MSKSCGTTLRVVNRDAERRATLWQTINPHPSVRRVTPENGFLAPLGHNRIGDGHAGQSQN